MSKWIKNQRGVAELVLIGLGMIWGLIATVAVQQFQNADKPAYKVVAHE